MFFQKANNILLLIALTGIILCSACKQDLPATRMEPAVALDVPPHFPAPPAPPDNPLTTSKIELGRSLFFDTRLSADNTISCGSCHLPEKAFADNNKVGIGIEGRKGFRNVPSLVNTVYFTKWLWDGGNPSLEAQVLVPLQDHAEMASDIPEVVEKLKGDPVYRRLSRNAFGKPFDADVMVKSLAAFERTLIFGNARYDQYLRGFLTLSTEEQEGLRLFQEINCTSCHSGVLFTSGKFESNGISTTPEDEGRYRITLNPDDLGKFKVPTLRNLTLTAPYMHDGRFNSIKEVVDYYNRGGDGHPNQSEKIKPLGLSELDKQNLIAFLKTLTDTEFLKDGFRLME